MIALGIRFLCGYSTATNLAQQRAEWPIHPGRVFMALAAAHYETGATPEERAALRWIEKAGAPGIRAGEGCERTIVKTYVPVNDSHGGISSRSRQDRTFPKTWLSEDTVYLIWETDAPEPVRASLEKLCRKVTRIGHSSSLVQMWVVEPADVPEPNWTPSSAGNNRMRIAFNGSLETLEAAFNEQAIRRFEDLHGQLQDARGKAKAALKMQIEQEFPAGRPQWRRPQLANWQGYIRRKESVNEALALDGPFDPDIVILCKTEGRSLGLEATLQITGAIRDATMKAAMRGNPTSSRLPEWVSGHTAGGGPSLQPHIAFIPLPYVGAEYADGHVMGIGMALPRSLNPEGAGSREEAIRQALGPLLFDPETGEERSVRLWRKERDGDGIFWEWTLDRETRERPPVALRAATWVRASRIWASVTPVVLHHYPKKGSPEDVERIVREAFISAQLPEPDEIRVQSVSAVTGAGHARAIPPFDEGGAGLCKYQTHVIARFRTPVRGPVLVGRGRYRGYGLLRPFARNEEAQADGN